MLTCSAFKSPNFPSTRLWKKNPMVCKNGARGFVESFIELLDLVEARDRSSLDICSNDFA